MPKHMLMSGIEIITDGGRRRRSPVTEKPRVVEETLEDGDRTNAYSILIVAGHQPGASLWSFLPQARPSGNCLVNFMNPQQGGRDI
ncbi:hypothetical protein A3728_19295 [Sulfitobacter sp. HI0040]|jgi:hypothetical protein|nr:hypothetical protein A3721_06990 [Sulfitobacter sp. HI0023]KZY25330.1 hypothetical protein A3728_19295 [Sulfitobacter sp. HI0040]KZZ62877.1 hypothetical protein A3764_05955 [Sulfitobacter sp. HI0129]